jgi:MFS family permease
MIISPLAMAGVSPFSGALSDRLGSRLLTTLGLVISGVGYAVFVGLNEHTTTLVYILSYAAIGIGMGIFQSPNNSTIMGSAPKDRLGVASGLLSLTRIVGQAAGISILGAIWEATVLRNLGSLQGSDATLAPVHAQVLGLHNALFSIVVIILVAFVLSVWALFTVRRAERNAIASD